MHTQSSTLFRAECRKLPQHNMHIHARMLATMYLAGRYGRRVQAHRSRIALALSNMEPLQV